MNLPFDWAKAPESIPESKIAKTIDADIVIIGAGQAGTCVARAAAENGARVIVIEQQSNEKQWILGVGEIGHINSKWQADRGVPKVAVDEFVSGWQLRTNNRSNARLIRKYAENCGDCFDWFIEPLSKEEKDAIYPVMTPQSPHFPESVNGLRVYSGSAKMGMALQNKAVKGNQQIAMRHGAQFFFNMRARLLEHGEGYICGVIAQNRNHEYIRFRAGIAVVLAAGDYSGNPKMCTDLLTEAADLIEPGTNWCGHGWDGSGIRMGVWAGGRLEPRSHAALGGNYSFPGFDVIGSTAVLRVNKYGNRYSDEAFATHVHAALQGAKQPNGMLWGIFDRDIITQVEYQAPCHAVFDYTEPERIKKLEQTLERAQKAGADGVTTAANRPLYCTDTLEELASYLFQDADSVRRFLETVERYNALCALGEDLDFGKARHFLHPITKAPFYACGQLKDSHTPGGQSLKLLVTVSGLLIDENQQVLDDDFEPISGLYATGNASGCRFGFQYSTSMPGQSISIAQTLGRELGRYLTQLAKERECYK